MTPDTRRAVRTAVHAIGAIAMLGMLAWIIYHTRDAVGIAMGLVLILLVRELFHGAENVTARIKFTVSPTGANAEVDPGDGQ